MNGGNPFYVAPLGGDSFNTGLGLLGQGLGMREARQQEAKQKQMQADLMRQAGELYRAGDMDAIIEFGIQNPELSQSIMNAINQKTGIRQDEMLDVTKRILATPDSTEQILTDRIAMIEARGGDPKDTMQQLELYRSNPEEFIKSAETALVFADPAAAKEYRASKPKQPEEMTEYQRAMIENKQEENRLRALENEQKILDRQLQRETDALKKAEIQQKIDAKKSELDKAVAEKESSAIDSYVAGQDTIDLINRIESHPGFSSYVGAKGASSLFGLKDEPVAGTDAAGVAAMIETLKAKNFLNSIEKMKGMGALSNDEGNKVAAAVESLNPNMKEKDFKNSLNVIREITQRGLDKQAKILGEKTPKPKVNNESNKAKFPNAPDIGAVNGGYEYIGGNPASPDSWRKK